MNPFSLEGRTAPIVGANRGLGLDRGQAPLRGGGREHAKILVSPHA